MGGAGDAFFGAGVTDPGRALGVILAGDAFAAAGVASPGGDAIVILFARRAAAIDAELAIAIGRRGAKWLGWRPCLTAGRTKVAVVIAGSAFALVIGATDDIDADLL